MKPFHTILVVVLVSVVVSYGAVKVFMPIDGSMPESKKESVFDKVVRTNTLQCGYAVATPWFMVDAETGKFSGYAYDATMAIAEKMGLDVQWMEETGWGVAEQGLVTGRYDVMCGTVCVDPKRVKAALYSTPLVYIPILAVVRADDHRFDDQGIEAMDDPAINIGVKNGHVFEYVANERFPHAAKVYANDISDDTDFLLMLKTGKIDVAFSGQITVDMYTKQNGDIIKSLGEPVRYCAGGFMIPHGEYELKHMIDASITELNASKTFDRIAKKYMPLEPKYVRMPAQRFR